MLISIGLYMFNVVCAATGNMQNFPRQLAMQSCALCLIVRCGTSNQIKKSFFIYFDGLENKIIELRN